MRPSITPATLAAAFVLLVAPTALAAQTAGAAPNASRPLGCRGTNTQSSSFSFMRPDSTVIEFPDYSEILTVQPGSPAELAGLRSGDIVVAQDGRDLIANPPAQPRLAGDTVVLTVRRNGSEIPVTVVLGYWDPPQEAPGVTRVCRRVGAGGG